MTEVANDQAAVDGFLALDAHAGPTALAPVGGQYRRCTNLEYHRLISLDAVQPPGLGVGLGLVAVMGLLVSLAEAEK